jgi:hypothetical protein
MAERYLLQVDGEAVGSLRSFQGLDVEAEVGTHGVGPHRMPKKHVAGVRWTPGVATFGGDMGGGMRGWIAEALDGGTAIRGGSVAVVGAGGSPGFSVAFSGARLSAVTFPALDGASKEAALMSAEFGARQVRWGEGGGASVQAPDKSKEWLQSSFRVEIGDLPCERVARVDAFTWTCAADGTVTVPDIRLVISRADLAAWDEAARRWFVDREYRDKHEMDGRITLLSANGQDELASIELGNVGLKRFSHDDLGGAFAVLLYVEKLGLTLRG